MNTIDNTRIKITNKINLLIVSVFMAASVNNCQPEPVPTFTEIQHQTKGN